MNTLTVFMIAAVVTPLLTCNLASAQFAVGDCSVAADNKQKICGVGTNALRVIAGTESPDSTYAVAWRRPGGDPENFDEDAQNFLVRLRDGAIIGRLKGDYWYYKDAEANHVGESVVWAPDASSFIEIVDGKWQTRSLSFFRIVDGSKLSPPLDLRALIYDRLRKRLSAHHPRRLLDRYVIAGGIAGNILLTGHGTAFLSVSLSVPKSMIHPDYGYDVMLRLKPGNHPEIAAIVPRPNN